MTLDRILSIVSITFALSLGSGFALSPKASIHEPKGFVKGKVTGVNIDGGMPDVRITFQSASVIHEVITDKNGAYSAELPVDVYTITATVAEYYPYRRAPFRVRSGGLTIINVGLAFRVHDTGYSDSPKIYYEKLALPAASDEELDLLVEYENRKDQGDAIEYDRARLYYDAVAISAMNLKLDKKNFRFKAIGNIHIDDGHHSGVYVRQADIHFSRSEPIIEATLGAIDHVSGHGSIDSDTATFEFVIEKDHVGRLSYRDNKLGLSFTSDDIMSFRVVDDEAGRVEFNGSARIKFDRAVEIDPETNYIVPINFQVTVQDTANAGPDTFSIKIELSHVLTRSGQLSKGEIRTRRAY